MAWQSHNGTDSEIRGRLIAASGTPIGNDFLVASTSAGSQTRVSVTALADGRFFAVWASDDSGVTHIRGRLFNADGSGAGDDFIVGTLPDSRFFPTVSALPDGRLSIDWQASVEADYEIHGTVLAYR